MGKMKLTIESKSWTVASVKLCFIISMQKNIMTAPTLSGDPGYKGLSSLLVFCFPEVGSASEVSVVVFWSDSKILGTKFWHPESISISSYTSASSVSKSSTTSFGLSLGYDSCISDTNVDQISLK